MSLSCIMAHRDFMSFLPTRSKGYLPFSLHHVVSNTNLSLVIGGTLMKQQANHLAPRITLVPSRHPMESDKSGIHENHATA